MTSGPATTTFDVLLIGSGLGATAAARLLALDGVRVGFVAGVGRSRSLESDGGLVDPHMVEQAFGVGAPLGQLIRQRQGFVAEGVGSQPVPGPLEEMAPRRTYRRLELEMWARQQAQAAGAVYLDGFVEGQALPLSTGLMSLTDEANERSLISTTIALCEGSDPRIAMRVGLRPDYVPEEQIHFARAIIACPQTDVVYRHGRTRTSWGMPIGVTIVPLGATTMVAVDTRIENVMRAARSTQEALLDLLTSPLGRALGLNGERLHSGIELSALRSQPKHLRLAQHRLLIGIDASGLIDTREARRADVTIRSGLHLAAYLGRSPETTWEMQAAPLLEQVRAVNPRWHDSRGTGFIEEAESAVGLIDSISKMGKGVIGRWRKRA